MKIAHFCPSDLGNRFTKEDNMSRRHVRHFEYYCQHQHWAVLEDWQGERCFSFRQESGETLIEAHDSDQHLTFEEVWLEAGSPQEFKLLRNGRELRCRPAPWSF
jgi:hypothetical protein